jgi:hypothetical protein
MHNTATVFVTAALIAAALSTVSQSERRTRLVRNYLLVFGTAALLYVPWVPFLFQQTGQVYEKFWKELPAPEKIPDILSSIYLYSRHHPWLNAVLLGLFALGWWEMRRQRGLRRMLVWLAVSAPLIIYLISLKRSIFLPRLMLWGPLPFYVICGFGLRALRPRALFLAGCLALAAAGVLPLQRYYRAQSKPPWHALLAVLEQEVGGSGPDNSEVILASSGRTFRQLNYYRSRKTDPVNLGRIRLPKRKTGLPPAVRRADVVWFVAAHKPRRERRRHQAELLKKLSGRFAHGDRRVFRKRLLLVRFER